MFGALLLATWFLATLLWAWRRRRAVNHFDAGLTLGGSGLWPQGRGLRWRGGGSSPRGGGLDQPHDPFSGVRHPNTRRPSGNSAAVEVNEPDEDEALTLIGVSKSHTLRV